ncbi:succinoglycan biosynthesis protein ExoL [Rhizobium mongolense subsp. loessense]|uniref:Succinoglycan biosynthesis protein ExoL n=1 Tax=Rhizobium mongolense subsp. loessense TaxID=158890 RepID=A0A1G4TLJ9_9HYPH|nr:glycosyltransferase family 4 protein [Rhizobium mongolense]SCW82256.1 succinoglycan biosynthesis protein ExoL [Rhizobium mongolense subsp. loessense]
MAHVLYLVHDLSDPAVRRRLIMLTRGGATVDLAGFSRAKTPGDIEGIKPVNLGKTADGRFFQRTWAVLKAMARLRSVLAGLTKPDVIVARNLETLALANSANGYFGGSVPIVYECLDIHRLLIGMGPVARSMRFAERWFGRNVSAIVTSSPAFKTNYFDVLSFLKVPVMLVENKVFAAMDDGLLPASQKREDRPWRIGWFGALRCRKSLKLLAQFSRMANGRFEIILRGRPAYSEFDDFDAFVANEPFMHFCGPYRNPEDLGPIYGEVDFAWTADCFEEGYNSKWLLPNRLYEGCLHGAVPIAVQGTETAEALRRHNIGLILADATSHALSMAMEGLDVRRFKSLKSAVAACDRRNWAIDEADCKSLVAWLAGLAPAKPRKTPDHFPISSSFAI